MFSEGNAAVKIRISGDGARMTRLTNYVIFSYCLLATSLSGLLPLKRGWPTR